MEQSTLDQRENAALVYDKVLRQAAFYLADRKYPDKVRLGESAYDALKRGRFGGNDFTELPVPITKNRGTDSTLIQTHLTSGLILQVVRVSYSPELVEVFDTVPI
jgi:hypothetical protein